MRDYGVVRVRFWDWAKRKKLSQEAKEMAVYLLTCPHGNSLGCFRLPVAYICDDLGNKLNAVMGALGELAGAGFIDRDEDSGWTWIIDYLEHNPVPNGKVGKAIAKLVDQVPSSLSFHAALVAEMFNHEHIDHDALQESAAKRKSREAVSASQDTVSATLEPIDPTQDPNHDQDQDQTHDHNSAGALEPDPQIAFQIFVEASERHGWPTPRSLEPDRRKKIKARLAEHGIDGWREMIDRAGRSDWLKTSFPLRIDWALEPKNFRKVIEGNYDDRAASPEKPKREGEIASLIRGGMSLKDQPVEGF